MSFPFVNRLLWFVFDIYYIESFTVITWKGNLKETCAFVILQPNSHPIGIHTPSPMWSFGNMFTPFTLYYYFFSQSQEKLQIITHQCFCLFLCVQEVFTMESSSSLESFHSSHPVFTWLLQMEGLNVTQGKLSLTCKSDSSIIWKRWPYMGQFFK